MVRVMPITPASRPVRHARTRPNDQAITPAHGDAAAPSIMLVAPEVVTVLHAPTLGAAARAFCGALQTPDVHGAAVRDTLAAFVRQAREDGMPLAELTETLRMLVRECAQVPPHDRAGFAEYVVRRAELLYESE